MSRKNPTITDWKNSGKKLIKFQARHFDRVSTRRTCILASDVKTEGRRGLEEKEKIAWMVATFYLSLFLRCFARL